MASSVLALTMATLLKGTAAAGDASAAEKGLVESKSGRQPVTAETSTGDEKGGVSPSVSARKPPAPMKSHGTGSSAVQAPATQRTSLLQRVLSRGSQRPFLRGNAPAEADAVSVDGADPADGHADGPAADGSTHGATEMPEYASAPQSRSSNDTSAQSPAAVPAAEVSTTDDAASPGTADAGEMTAGAGDCSEAAAAATGCGQDPDASHAGADIAAEAAPAGSTSTAAHAGGPRRRGRLQYDDEAATFGSGKAPRAAASATVGAGQHDDATADDAEHGAEAAQLVAPVPLAMQRSPPQQRTQRQAQLAGVAASTARPPAARIVAAAPAGGRKQPGRELPQVRGTRIVAQRSVWCILMHTAEQIASSAD